MLGCKMSVARPPPYTPPRQTADQKRIMAGIIQRASVASNSATAAVLRKLNNTKGSACNEVLANTSFANASASELLRLLYDVIVTAELAHSFHVGMGVRSDASLATDMNLSFYPNLYQTRSE